jgi:hypothetical protein
MTRAEKRMGKAVIDLDINIDIDVIADILYDSIACCVAR